MLNITKWTKYTYIMVHHHKPISTQQYRTVCYTFFFFFFFNFHCQNLEKSTKRTNSYHPSFGKFLLRHEKKKDSGMVCIRRKQTLLNFWDYLSIFLIELKWIESVDWSAKDCHFQKHGDKYKTCQCCWLVRIQDDLFLCNNGGL